MWRDSGSGILAIIALACLRAGEVEKCRRCSEQFAPEPNQSLPFFVPSTEADWNERPLPSKRKPGNFMSAGL